MEIHINHINLINDMTLINVNNGMTLINDMTLIKYGNFINIVVKYKDSC